MKSVFHSSYFISGLFPPYNLIATTANGEFELWISCTPRGANQLNFKALGKHDTRLDTPFGFVLFNQNNEMDSLQIEILFLSVMCVCVCIYILHPHLCQSENSKTPDIFFFHLQVGLSGKAHSLQRDLNNLAGAGDTSEKKGFHIILTGSYGINGIFFIDDIVNLY